MRFKKLSLMDWKKFVFYAMFLTMIILQVLNESNNLTPDGIDEVVFAKLSQQIVNIGTIQGFFDVLANEHEIKSAAFIGLQVLLKVHETIAYTRALNIVLILLIMLMMYDMTKRKEVLLFPLIPWFLNSLWLTNEIVEVFFVIVSIRFIQYSGFLIGIATVLRPWALVYTMLLKRNQIKYVLAVGLVYVMILLYYNSFFVYLDIVLNYSVARIGPSDYVATFFLIFFLFIGYKTPMFKYGIVSMLCLLTKLSYHYFIPVYTFFFFGYLLELSLKKPTKSQINAYENLYET